jgi:hypothetical protein
MPGRNQKNSLKLIKNTVSEKEIQNQILTWLWYNRINAWQNDSVGIYDAKKRCFRKKGKFHVNGRPDIEGVLHGSGRYFGIEVKTATGVVSESQKEFMMRISSLGGIIFVARSLDDVIRVMGEYANGY